MVKKLFIYVIFYSISLCALGQEKLRVTAKALQAGEELRLDGKVNENLWTEILPASDFLQQEPQEGRPSTEKTEVRIAYDEKNLYIGVNLFDSEPDKIKGFQRRRDESLETDDSFTMIIDSYNDQRSSYFFEINPLGLMRDGILRTGQGSNLNIAWNGIWQAWVSVTARGWEAEIRIPLMTLNFDPDLREWGINFQRIIRRKNEIALWSGHQRNQGIRRPQDAGVLDNLSGLSQGIGLEAIPYVIGTQKRIREGKTDSFSSTYSANAGGEINYNINPNLKAGVTINTDFAETEVDNRQVNLTRFPLFFPERRDFFLQGANVFLFAPASNPNPYFSRRVGLESGRPVPIRYGARMIGRIKSTDVGFYQVSTAESEFRGAENFTVARVLQNLGSESTVGAIYTRRQTADDSVGVRETYGADLSLSTSKFLGNKNLQFEAFIVGHSPDRVEGAGSQWDRSVRGFRFNFPNQPWEAHTSYREFGTAYNPAVGFAPRVGFRRLQPSISFSPLVENSAFIRELSWGYYLEYLMGMDWKPLTVNNRLSILGIRLESGDNMEIRILTNYEFLDFPFDILRDGQFVIETGNYNNQGYSLDLSTAGFRRVGGSLSYSNIGFWTGRRQNLQMDAFFRPVIGLNISTRWDHSTVRLAEGSFQTNLFQVITAYDFSPWVSLNFNIQYDNLSKFLGTNTRFVWVIEPGNTLFVVYNHNWIEQMERLITTETGTAVKLAYTFRF